MIRMCLSALLSHWWRNPLQLFALLAGLALATALWSGVQAINAEARASYDAAASTLGEGQYDQLVPLTGDRIPLETYVALRRAGWLVSPIVDGSLNGIRIVGIDPLTSPTRFGLLAATEGDTVQMGQSETLFGDAETAARLAGKARVTTNTNVAPGIAIGDISTVQALLSQNHLNRLLILPDQPARQPPLRSIAPELQRQTSQQVADVAQLTDSFHLNLTAFGLLSFAVGLFIVHSTIGLAFEQRRGMVRTLRSLGVPLRTLLILISLEMLSLAVIGAGVGVLMGYGIAALLLPDVAATLRGLYGAEVAGTLRFRPSWWVSGFLLALLGAAAALSGRIWQLSRMPLLASVKPRAWVMGTMGRTNLQWLFALVLLIAAAALLLVGEGLLAGFATLGCLLIGAALALPILAGWMLKLAEQRARAPLWQWFWADTRQQLPGLSLALMALLLAVAANIGVSTMVSSFRLTFIGFLDQRLAPELFIQVETADQSAALEDYLVQRDFEILPVRSTDAVIAGLPSRLYGARVGATYRENWRFLDQTVNPWDTVEEGTAVIVNEQLARRAKLWVWDVVTIAPDLTLPIAAVVGDYGNPQGQVVIAEHLFTALHPEIFTRQFGIRTGDPNGLQQQLIGDLGLPDGAIIDQASVKRLSLEIFERTFAVTSALNVLTLGVAGFAILMSLLTLADLRVPQLAPVWALGLTRRTLGLLELGRAVALSFIVFICAVPLGLVLAWLLLTVVNVEAFGWQLPVFFFPLSYVELGAYAAAAAVLAAGWPALRLMRTPPSALLKVFANER